ncbi:hypothetical protein K0M31_000919 [Melipona bicolor]|uniref:Uncharacterized protein n=1 Tax=Melipona bicolor TaxID=60889 RepID=A0AA40GEJ0_9HYME|nr:hypothetical protein K0M31_000919 [Melipona bicolor]
MNHFVAFSLGDSSSNHTSLPGINPSLNNTVKFVRNIVWKGVFYLLICYESGSCNIYTFDNLQLKYRQTIRHKGHPTDASFFVRANRLYLVVADNIGPFSVPSL